MNRKNRRAQAEPSAAQVKKLIERQMHATLDWALVDVRKDIRQYYVLKNMSEFHEAKAKGVRVGQFNRKALLDV